MPEPTSTLPSAPAPASSGAPLPDAAQLLQFEHGLPGFPSARRFALVADPDGPSPFALLQSLDDENLAFVVAHPYAFFADYTVDLDDSHTEQLGIESADDAIVLVIVTLGPTLDATTANLLGPIVVNQRTRRAIQAILSTSPYDARTPLHA